MTDTNHVVIIGRLTKDCEVRYAEGSPPICSFSIAVNRRKKTDGEWTEEASFFNVTLFGKQGESLQRYLVKGKQVAIVGELRQERWEKDGQKHNKVIIIANNIQLLGSKSDNSESDNVGNKDYFDGF